jgi:hypothetical protein
VTDNSSGANGDEDAALHPILSRTKHKLWD